MTWLIVSSLAIAIIYIGIVVWKTGDVPVSISAIVYEFDKSWAVGLWTLWLWIVGITASIATINALPSYMQWFGFTMLCCFGALGAMPLIKGEKQTLHYIMALLAGIHSQVCVAFICPWWLLIWLWWFPIIAGAVAALNDCSEQSPLLGGKAVMIAECTCAISLYGCLLSV